MKGLHSVLKFAASKFQYFCINIIGVAYEQSVQAAVNGALTAGGCYWRAKHGREEPPQVWGQGQKSGGPHARRAEAKRSYPTSEVRGSGWEYQTGMAQEWPRGATLRLRSGGQLRGDNQRPRSGAMTRGVTPRPRSGAVAGRSYPMPPHLRPGTAAGRSNPMHEARGSGWEDQPHVQQPQLRGHTRA